MARDQIEVMRQLGFERFFVAGHDRGGRCAYRMALDHPERVLKLAVLDMVPTGEVFRRADMAFGLGYWHWFFLAQPHDLPERLIGADPDYYFRWRRLERGRNPTEFFSPAALEDYLRCFRNPETIHAICEDSGRRHDRFRARRDGPRKEAHHVPRARPVGSSWHGRGLVRRAVPAALGISTSYYLLCTLGEVATMMGPRSMTRHFRI